MKKLFKFLVGSLLLVSALNANDIGFTNKMKKDAYLVMGKNTMWYIQNNMKTIKEDKIKQAFGLIKQKICTNVKMKEAIAKGLTFEYIYISDIEHKAVVYKINNCN